MCAGAALHLAGFSSGTGVGARGGTDGAIRNAECVIRNSELGGCMDSLCFVFRSKRIPAVEVLLPCFAFGSRLLFDAERQTGRLAGRYVSIPAWVGIAIRAFLSVSMVIGLRWFTLGLCVFLLAIPTGLRSWRRDVGALLSEHIGFAMFPAGSTLGLRAPDCAKETLSPWTLII